ncbi:MAG: hypothetical protein FJ387_17495 [Verrucomicrobia bacterium]|nr:hypothetical protein [Verrucomicrobiota bacterium]
MLTASLRAGEPAPIALILRNQQEYLPGRDLETHAGIAVKPLPNQDDWVACAQDRCARLSGIRREGDLILVPLTNLTRALALTATRSADARAVVLEFAPQTGLGASPVAEVGQLVPDLLLRGLGGEPISLRAFRGRRVLINSWASW